MSEKIVKSIIKMGLWMVVNKKLDETMKSLFIALMIETAVAGIMIYLCPPTLYLYYYYLDIQTILLFYKIIGKLRQFVLVWKVYIINNLCLSICLMSILNLFLRISASVFEVDIVWPMGIILKILNLILIGVIFVIILSELQLVMQIYDSIVRQSNKFSITIYIIACILLWIGTYVIELMVQ